MLGDGGLHLVVALFHDLPREKTRLSSHFISHDFGKLTLVENETFLGGFQPQLFSKLSKLLIVIDVHSWENCIRTTKVPNTQEFRNFALDDFFSRIVWFR